MSSLRLSQSAVLVGSLLCVLSTLWLHLASRGAWSQADAQRWQDAAADFHHASYTHGDRRRPQADAQIPALEVAKQRFDQVQLQLDNARSRGQWAAAICWWAGIGCVTAGGVLYAYIAARDASDQSEV